MDLQSTISRKKNEALIGSIQRVMIDEVDLDSDKATRSDSSPRTRSGRNCLCRGMCLTGSKVQFASGAMVDVRITGALDYDLIGEIIHGLKPIRKKKKNSEKNFSKQAAEMLEEMKRQLMKEMQGRVKEETEGVKDEGRDTYDLRERRKRPGNQFYSQRSRARKARRHRRSAAADQPRKPTAFARAAKVKSSWAA